MLIYIKVMLTAIIVFVIILSVIVFIHELGHFMMARYFGVKCDEFGFGLPPRIIGIVKNDENKWEIVKGKSRKEYRRMILSLNWIPVGGFVAIKGENGEDKESTDSFGNRPIWQRISMVSAGVIMNVVLAFAILTFGFLVGLPSVTDNLPAGAQVTDPQIQVFTVLEDSPAGLAGIEPGDTIEEINGTTFTKTEELQAYIQDHQEDEMNIILSRQGDEVSIDVTPVVLEETGEIGVGVGLADIGLVSYPVHWAVIRGAESTIYLTKAVVLAFYELFKNIIVKQEVAVGLSGPVGIAVLTGKFARMGFAYVLQFAALLTINLAVINFLPFPALDGGRVLFLMIEKIRRRPIPQKIEAAIHNTGFLLLLVVLALVTFRDIAQASDKIISGIKSLIGM
jgi:regulator of sigma E protease